jgi:hypothetical protein
VRLFQNRPDFKKAPGAGPRKGLEGPHVFYARRKEYAGRHECRLFQILKTDKAMPRPEDKNGLMAVM